MQTLISVREWCVLIKSTVKQHDIAVNPVGGMLGLHVVLMVKSTQMFAK